MNLDTHNNRFKEWLWLVFPFVVWVIVFWEFLNGQLDPKHDFPSYYYRIKYYLDSIQAGVFPMWNPFSSWGCQDDLDMRFLGEYNPFLFLIVFLRIAGVPFYLAFMAFVALYHWLGMLGFYWLSKKVLKSVPAALLSYNLLLFSSLSQVLFNEQVITFIVVPYIWFFAFLAAFVMGGKRRDLIGLTFSLMIIATTYLPFYFITCTGIIFIFGVIFFPVKIFEWAKRLFGFLWKQRAWTFLCVVALSISILPGLKWYMDAKLPHYVFDSVRVKDAPQGHMINLNLNNVNIGNVLRFISGEDLYSGQNFFSMDDVVLYYFPGFMYLVLMLSIINRFNRLSAVFLFSAFIIFLLSTTNSTPLSQFLYDHCGFFRMFRNRYFLFFMAYPLFALFVAEQFKHLLAWPEQSPSDKKKLGYFILITHAGLLSWLSYQEFVITSSFITIAASAAFFTAYVAGYLPKNSGRFMLALTAIVLIQPIEIYSNLAFNSSKVDAAYSQETERPQFSFIRPLRGNNDDILPGFYGYQGRKKIMKDVSGFVNGDYFGTKWSYWLHGLPPGQIENYVHYKFLLYDHAIIAEDSELYWGKMLSSMKDLKNIAYIYTDHGQAQKLEGEDENKFGFAQPILENSDAFRVVKFNHNKMVIMTNFQFKKYFVYNDSFHPFWLATLNGQQIKIDRANYAFKGFWLNAGKNILVLEYNPAWGRIFKLILILFWMVFGYLMYLVIIKKK